MRLRPLALGLLLLAALDGVARLRSAGRRRVAARSPAAGRALLSAADLERAHRIVVREKPQSRLLHREEGFEVRAIAGEDESERESVLERRGGGWVVASYHGLEADPQWLGQTLRDLGQGRLLRFLTSDPELCAGLGLGAAQVRLEDARGRLLRRLEFGRQDGGEAYQFVRVDGREAFVAKHEAVLLGDPMAWVVTRILAFDAAEVREAELPFQDAREPPLRVRRAARGRPLQPLGEAAAFPAQRAADYAERLLARLLAEPFAFAVGREVPLARAARAERLTHMRLTLFDGRRYGVDYAALRAGAARAHRAAEAAGMALAFVGCSDPSDLASRYGAQAAFAYREGDTLGRFARSRAALASPRSPRRRG